MNRFVPAALAALTLAAGCSLREDTRPYGVKTMPLSLRVNADARTYLNGTTACWSSGDQLLVFDSARRGYIFGSAASGSTSLMFDGEITENEIPLYALYPADALASFTADGLIRTTLKWEQAAANNNSWPNHTNVAVGHIDVVSPGEYASEMRNVCGFLCFAVSEEYKGINNGKKYAASHVRRVVVEVGSGSLAGDITIDYNDGEPRVTAVENGKSKVSLRLKAYKHDETGKPFYFPGSYFIPVLPGDYKGVTLTVEFDDGRENRVLSSTNTLHVRRSVSTFLGQLSGDDMDLDLNSGTSPFYRKEGEVRVPLSSEANTDTGGVEQTWYTNLVNREVAWGFFAGGGDYFRHCPEEGALLLSGPGALIRFPYISGLDLNCVELSHVNPQTEGYVRAYICADCGDPATGRTPERLRYIDIPRAPARVLYYTPEQRIKDGDPIWLQPEKGPLYLRTINLKFVTPPEEESDGD